MVNFEDKYVDGRSLEQTVTEIYKDISSKQSKTDNTLKTTSKDIIGAINEVNGKIGSSGSLPIEEFGNTSTPTNLDDYRDMSKKYKSNNVMNKFTNLPPLLQEFNDNEWDIETFELTNIKIVIDSSSDNGYYLTQLIKADNGAWQFSRVYSYFDYISKWSWGKWSPNSLVGGSFRNANTIKEVNPISYDFTGVYCPSSNSSEEKDIRIITPSVPNEYENDLVKYIVKGGVGEGISVEFKQISFSERDTQFYLKFPNGVLILYGVYRERFFGVTASTKGYVTYATSFLEGQEVIAFGSAYKNVLNEETDSFTNIYDCTISSSHTSLVYVVRPDENARSYDMEVKKNSYDGLRWMAIGRWKE